MNIIYMGTPDFAVPTLQALLASEHTVQAVFTQPDKPRGRHGDPAPTPVKAEAVKAGLPVYQPKRIRDEENLAILQSYQPDVIVVAAFGQIIPKAILELPRYGCINVHASLLPAYRGAAPIQWAVINGDPVSGVTAMQMGEGLDTGDMLKKVIVPITEEETGGSLFDKLSIAGAELLLETLSDLEQGTIVPEKQPEESTTAYASMLTKDMGNIDWSGDAAAIERLVRGLDPWPSAFSYLKGKQLKIWKSRCADIGEKAGDLTGAGTESLPGTLGVHDGRLFVQTGDGVLEILELQLEGKKRMQADAFLRGFHLDENSILQRQR